jgi:hypothetical protein
LWWLVGRLVGRHMGGQVGRHMGGQVGRHMGGQVGGWCLFDGWTDPTFVLAVKTSD